MTGDGWEVALGDCREWPDTLPAGSADAVVTDPPYGLGKPPDLARLLTAWLRGRDYTGVGGGFMGKKWDGCVPGPNYFRPALRALRPGGYALVFAGPRTADLMGLSLRLAGFEVRDMILWLYGTGFPKGKGCLKPAYEPILLCRRPGPRVLPLNIDDCRVGLDGAQKPIGYLTHAVKPQTIYGDGGGIPPVTRELYSPAGRWPANVLTDGSDEVLAAFAAFGERTSGKAAAGGHRRNAGTTGNIYGGGNGLFPAAGAAGALYGDTGTAARFFYTAKASRAERDAGLDHLPEQNPFDRDGPSANFERMGSRSGPRKNTHPTVKPLALMRYLVRLVCPPGGLVLDPFAGSGTTLLAAVREGRRAAGCELNEKYHAIAAARLAAAEPEPSLC